MSRKALLIGINEYEKSRIFTCKEDAKRISELLAKNEDESQNFDVRTRYNLTCDQLRGEIKRWLEEKRAPDHALLFFAGHGYVEDLTGGYLVGKDYSSDDIGVSMKWLSEQIQDSTIKEITIILDCCHAGVFGKVHVEGRPLAHLPKNVTLLAAVTENDVASSGPKNGRFTELLIEGLEGAAADKKGRITAASLYQYASDKFSTWQQRPVFKSFITSSKSLRKCEINNVEKEEKTESTYSIKNQVKYNYGTQAGVIIKMENKNETK